MMVGLVAILIGLIMFGSIALIYNAFSISVSERTKQFGLLKSIGATNKQLRGTVLYEALVLCAVAIPLGLLVGCLGIGVTLRALRGTFDTILGENGGVQMGIALNGWVLLFAAAIGLLTAVISAWVPAQRAARIPAIDAIRQTRDVAVRGRQVKTSKLTYKLFGFPGMLAAKNFKRNRKQYRATVVSLFLSVVLFISASSFCAYLTESVNTMTSAAGTRSRCIRSCWPPTASRAARFMTPPARSCWRTRTRFPTRSETISPARTARRATTATITATAAKR